MSASGEFQEALEAFNRGDLGRARAIAEAAAVHSPSPRLHHLLGLVHCQLGDFANGAQWLRRASEGRPGNIGFKVMLIRALLDGGRPKEALDAADPPEGTSPPELALWHARAEAASAVQSWPEAVEAWQRLCSLGVAGWRAWSNLGDALGASGRWREAAVALEQAVALDPDNLQLRRNFAGALTNCGRLEESVQQFRRCIDAAPADKSLRISLAPILAELGRADEFDAELEKAAEIAGRREASGSLIDIVLDGSGAVDVMALVELSDLLERSDRTDELDRLLEDASKLGVAPEQVGFNAAAAALRRGEAAEAKRLLLTQDPSPRPARWHSLMARIADALGDFDDAFAEAEAMNRSERDYDDWLRQADLHIEWARGLVAGMTPEWAGGIAALQPGERRPPAFLVGFPRSGTTLLDTFLMGHPDVAVLEEVPLVHAIETALGQVTALPERSVEDMARAREAYLAELGRHVDPAFDGVPVDKLPLNMMAAPYLHAAFPDAPFLFAQRHPCDCVLSCFMQNFALNKSMACFLDIERGAALYDAAMTIWTRSCELLPIAVHTVVYEQLVVAPEDTLRPAIDSLGLDWREELLDHRSTARARGRIITPSYNQVTKPLTTSAAGRWRRYEKHLEPVLPILLPWAERLGYRD